MKNEHKIETKIEISTKQNSREHSYIQFTLKTPTLLWEVGNIKHTISVRIFAQRAETALKHEHKPNTLLLGA